MTARITMGARGLVVLIGLLGIVGCSSGTKRVDPDTDDDLGGTGLESSDVRDMAREMAGSLLGQEIIFENGTPRILVREVKNETRFYINSSLLVEKIRTNLIEDADRRIIFLAREHMDEVLAERQRQSEGAVGASTDEDGPRLKPPSGADYILTGKLQGISKTTGGDASDYIRAVFTLVDVESAEVYWERDYELKKIGKSGIVYR